MRTTCRAVMRAWISPPSCSCTRSTADSGHSPVGTAPAAAISAVRVSTPCSTPSTPVRALPSTRNGSAGKSTTANAMARTPPISASKMRSNPTPLRYRASTRIAETAVWLANIIPWPIWPWPMNTATHNAIRAASAMATAPGPSSACTRLPIPIPRVTPIIIWTARCARNTLLIDNDTAAAIGAKNGCG